MCVGKEEEGKELSSNLDGRSSSVFTRQRSNANGNGKGGYQKRHQEWLEKFGEVKNATACRTSYKNCSLVNLKFGLREKYVGPMVENVVRYC